MQEPMISIAASVHDDSGNGYVVLRYSPGASSFGPVERRVTSVKTLDGGNMLIDMGFSSSDAVPSFTARATSEQIIAMKYIQENFPLVVVSTDQGCYTAAIKSLQSDNGIIKFTLALGSILDA